MRNWETIWPAGLLLGIVMIAILDATRKAMSFRR